MRRRSTEDVPRGFVLRATLSGAGSTHVAWSPDGRRISAGLLEIAIWNTQSGERESTLTGHEGIVFSTSWSPVAPLLASAAGDRTARIWSLETGDLVHVLAAHEGYVRRVAWAPHGNLLATASDDHTAIVWDPEDGAVVRRLVGHSDRVYGLAWSLDGSRLATGSADGSVAVWDIADGTKHVEFAGHQRSVHCVAWSPDGTTLASAGSRTIKLWRQDTPHPIAVLSADDDHGPVTYVGFSFDGQLLAARHLYGAITVWLCETAMVVGALHERSMASSPPDPAFSPVSLQLATVANDRDIRVWDLDDVAMRELSARRQPTATSWQDGDRGADRLSVFICHASEDKPAARALYQELLTTGFSPWLDEQSLLPGQDWELEIRRALRQSHVVLVCLSPRSVDKEGFLQKEIRQALDVADEKPEGTIFVVPIKLEECAVPDRLRRWHWLDRRDPSSREKLTTALRARAQELGIDA